MSSSDLSVVFTQTGKEIKRLDVSLSNEGGLGELIEKVKIVQSETNQFLTSLLSVHDIANDDNNHDDEDDDLSDVESEPDSKVPKIQ